MKTTIIRTNSELSSQTTAPIPGFHSQKSIPLPPHHKTIFSHSCTHSPNLGGLTLPRSNSGQSKEQVQGISVRRTDVGQNRLKTGAGKASQSKKYANTGNDTQLNQRTYPLPETQIGGPSVYLLHLGSVPNPHSPPPNHISTPNSGSALLLYQRPS